MKVLMLLIGAFISPFLAGVLVGFGWAVRMYSGASRPGARAVEISKTQQGAGGGEIVDPEPFHPRVPVAERSGQWTKGERKFCARRAG